jgi:MFS family permease
VPGGFGGLWRHAEFRRLWAGQTISQIGSQITMLALPLTATLVLDASPLEMGILSAAEYLPFLLVGLFAGVWVDRVRRRPILVATDLARAVLLGSIPLAAALDVLSLEQLYAVGFLVGVATVFFDVAYQSFLPALVGRAELVEGNSKLEASRSIAQIAGPGLAGGLVSLITAPMALAIDAVSFVGSALFLSAIRAPEAPPAAAGASRSVWGDIRDGLRVVVDDPVLRSIAGCTATANLFGNVGMAIYVLYVTRELGIGPALLGTILAVGSVGAVVGALVGGAVARRLGVGPTIVLSAGLFGLSGALVAAAAGSPAQVIAMLTAAQAVSGLAGTTYNINQVSLRQAVTPDQLQGRMNATMRFLVWGTIPIGALAGGVLGERIGMRPTLFVAALGSLLPVLWVLLSPVRGIRAVPTAAQPTAG